MTPEFHDAKAERIAGAMRKLTDADYEAVIEASMLAGTHWFNLALHRSGLTGPDADVMHAEYLDGRQRLMLSLHAPALLAALDEIESYRARFVRGDVAGGERVAARCRDLLRAIRDAAPKVPPLRPR
jgi:hypothetical protein